MRTARYLTATPLLLAGLMLAALFMGQAVGTSALPAPDQGTAAEAMAIRPPAEGSAEALLAGEECWTDEAPEGVAVPGRVVVRVGDDVAPTIGGDALVGEALEQLFGGVDHDLTVLGFCK